MTREQFAEKICIGHNLGNGLECIQPICGNGVKTTIEYDVTDINGFHDWRITMQYPEGDYAYFYDFESIWSNVPVTAGWFEMLADAGVQAIRIPINLCAHLTNSVPVTIDPKWLARIREVIDMCNNAGMIAILTLHTDYVVMYRRGSYLSVIDPDIHSPENDGVGRLMTLWKIMAEYVNDIPVDKLAFELNNEFRIFDFDDKELGDEQHNFTFDEKARIASRLNKYLFDAVRSVGGNAADRFILIGNYGNNPDCGRQIFIDTFKEYFDDKCLVTACYYCPWEFAVTAVFSSWEQGPEIKELMERVIQSYKDTAEAIGAPLVVTEYGCGCDEQAMLCKDKFSICRYIYTVMRLMNSNGVPAFIWDPGYILKRNTNEYGIPFWREMLRAVYFGEPFDMYEEYTEHSSEIDFGRLIKVERNITLEDIQALDNITESEEV